MHALARYRIAGLAAWLLCQQHHEACPDAEDPARRNVEIEAIRHRLDPPAEE